MNIIQKCILSSRFIILKYLNKFKYVNYYIFNNIFILIVDILNKYWVKYIFQLKKSYVLIMLKLLFYIISKII